MINRRHSINASERKRRAAHVADQETREKLRIPRRLLMREGGGLVVYSALYPAGLIHCDMCMLICTPTNSTRNRPMTSIFTNDRPRSSLAGQRVPSQCATRSVGLSAEIDSRLSSSNHPIYSRWSTRFGRFIISCITCMWRDFYQILSDSTIFKQVGFH